MHHYDLERIINNELKSTEIRDYAPNGLQIEGKSAVSKMICGVTACQALIDYAVTQHADAILVHHGYFWKNEPLEIKGMKAKRIRTLMQNNINLYAYHLPLDVHPTLGNNAQLAKLLNITDLEPLEETPFSIPIYGKLETPLTGSALAQRLEQVLHRTPLYCGDNAPERIKRVALCTGGGQDYIELAAANDIDAFITGEVSERTIHIAREMGIHFFAAGHHATERFGVQALGKWLNTHYDLDVEYHEVNNPA
ncbi:Nif3-like dinuclear metal center hexameric protein [Spirabiliibacterium falconis]|uniref:Nif3-like dinuclear metal center hexameric protein n=1 Tax=Spirabiliibacterium falconis TaxID=572023 RepID=UPI001AACFC80|nr:Nif3-like dinuclear metal center hexameric protein [Spirabiliibacterium falconis]MBE2894277.1 Nif3-like dinuclear metal center hexameric protein [Spirabiliibacterium falconis]